MGMFDSFGGFRGFSAAEFGAQKLQADLDNSKADAAYKKALVQDQQMNLLMKQQQMQQSQDTAKRMQDLMSSFDKNNQEDNIAKGDAPDNEALQTLDKQEKQYRKMSNVFLMSTNPTDIQRGEAFSKMADSAETKKADIAKKNLDATDKLNNDIGAYAGNVLAGDASPAEAFDFLSKRVGVKAAMAMPTDPEGFKRFWAQKQRASLSAADQLKMAAAGAEQEARRKDREQDHADNMEVKRMLAASTMQMREGKGPATVTLGDKVYEFDPDNKAQGERLKSDPRYVELGAGKTSALGGARERLLNQSGLNFANESLRGLDMLSKFNLGVSEGTFGHLATGDTVMKALTKVGGNKLTNQEEQMMQTSAKGLGLEIAQLATVGSGKGPNRSVVEEMSQMIAPVKGDTKFEAMYKIANAADFVRKRLETLNPQDEKGKAMLEKLQGQLNRYPDPGLIIEEASKHGHPISGETHQKMETLGDRLNQLGSDYTPSDEQRSLLDKYSH